MKECQTELEYTKLFTRFSDLDGIVCNFILTLFLHKNYILQLKNWYVKLYNKLHNCCSELFSSDHIKMFHPALPYHKEEMKKYGHRCDQCL